MAGKRKGRPYSLIDYTADVFTNAGMPIKAQLIYYELRRLKGNPAAAKKSYYKDLRVQGIKAQNLNFIDRFLDEMQLEIVYMTAPEILCNAYEISEIINSFDKGIEQTKKKKLEKNVQWMIGATEKQQEIIVQSVDKELEPKIKQLRALFAHFECLMKEVYPLIERINNLQMVIHKYEELFEIPIQDRYYE